MVEVDDEVVVRAKVLKITPSTSAGHYYVTVDPTVWHEDIIEHIPASRLLKIGDTVTEGDGEFGEVIAVNGEDIVVIYGPKSNHLNTEVVHKDKLQRL